MLSYLNAVLSDCRLECPVLLPWLSKLCVCSGGKYSPSGVVWYQALLFHQERIHPLKQSCCGRIPVQILLSLGPYLK